MRYLLTILLLIGLHANGQQPYNGHAGFHANNQPANPCTLWSNVATDADAVSFINRVHAAGYCMPAAEQGYYNTWYINAKAGGYYFKLHFAYSFPGTTDASAAVNLISASYTITWNGPGNVYNGGVEWGSQRYGKTGWVPSVALASNAAHIAYWCGSDPTGAALDMGVFKAGEGGLFMGAKYSALSNRQFGYGFGSIQSSAPTTSVFDLFTLTADGTTTKMYKGATETASAAQMNTRPSLEVHINGYNDNGTNSEGTARKALWASGGQYLSPSELSAYYSDLTQLLTSLGRL